MIILMTLCFFIILSSILFFIMNHPLSMGFTLMIQTMFIALFSGILTKTFWFSYSLFLIFMGGMLILFMYMTSLASNEIFKFSINFKMSSLFLILMTFFFMMMSLIDFKSFLFFNSLMNLEDSSTIIMKTVIQENQLTLNKMYNFPTNMISIMLVNYLFLTLIASVKITNIFKGPLRPNY